MSLIERPYNICFSKNEIRYVFQVSNLIRPGLFLQVKLIYLNINDVTEYELPSWDLKPDINGFVFIYIEKYLDSLLDYVLPSITQMFTNADAQAKQFYIKFREIEDAVPNPDWDTTESTNKKYVIKGGIEKHKNSRNNFFVNYFDVQKPWLTWQPNGRFIFDDEKAYLTFLNKDVDATGMKLRVTARDVSGTNLSQWTFNFSITSGILFHIAVGIQNLNIATNLTGALHYYDVQVVTAGNVAVNSNYRFYKEYRPCYYFYDLVYHNSISGIDFVRVKGEVDENFERTYDNGDGSGFNLDDWTNEAKPHQNIQTGLALQRTYKGDVGFLRTKKEQTSLVEITVSRSVYHKIFSRWVPVIILQKSGEVGKQSDKTRSFPIEWALSEVNEVYTPAEIGFGEGTNDLPAPPECIAADVSGTLPDAIVGQDYFVELAITGTTPVIMSDFAGPEWMTAEVIGSVVRFTGTPDAAATNVAVLFTLNNCDPDAFEFSDTIDVIRLEYNTDVTNDLPDVVIMDIFFNDAVCTPYEFFPITEAETGSATIPPDITSEIGVRFSTTPAGPVHLQIKKNGTIVETKTVDTPATSVIRTDNLYTFSNTDNIEIIVF
jgi:hypothetical protein